ncbi:hypothetical protein NEOLI_001880 [Neolecta irregularis DAH-3]|uniref:F-box domain-containing protein n=1 Tax=Neolecta irregularis (strain DAH-3) TaxID=1198029 RepID=A0A1U7LPD0_NEOID|nr:hypothetical protein NEOLI_001880 [Neolecta irregularis DAH-3]|eukprot:OLL24530.1 hypothetical protein NEOLI_001880 [Neolecta irregularis DAH-3]
MSLKDDFISLFPADLPTEVELMIYKFCSMDTLLNLRLTCRSANRVVNHHEDKLARNTIQHIDSADQVERTLKPPVFESTWAYYGYLEHVEGYLHRFKEFTTTYPEFDFDFFVGWRFMEMFNIVWVHDGSAQPNFHLPGQLLRPVRFALWRKLFKINDPNAVPWDRVGRWISDHELYDDIMGYGFKHIVHLLESHQELDLSEIERKIKLDGRTGKFSTALIRGIFSSYTV